MSPALAALVALVSAADPLAHALPDAPAALRPAIARAEAALQTLQKKVQPRLGKAMADGGPAAAIAICRDESPRLEAETAAESGLRLGRTSDRLRNPGHGAPAWATAQVRAAAGKKAAEVKGLAMDLGDRVGVLLPIAAGPLCLRCHGPADTLAPEVREQLGRSYPADAAVGYAAGDHRGFFWAEVAK
jgi:hypothetical protein